MLLLPFMLMLSKRTPTPTRAAVHAVGLARLKGNVVGYRPRRDVPEAASRGAGHRLWTRVKRAAGSLRI
ncbi:MAG TPA: hypothetical protein VGB82_27425 [Alphaproteobacteria bacterium]